MFIDDDVVYVEPEDIELDSLSVECASCAARHPAPQQNGNLQVDPEIRLPSPGMDVEISYFYNSFSNLSTAYGFGRTISTNLVLVASVNPNTVRLIRGDGAAVTFFELEPGKYGKKGQRKHTKVLLDAIKNEWVELGSKGVKTYYPVVPNDHESKVSRVVDAIGNCHTYSYDAQGLLMTLTDTVGRQVEFYYNSYGLLTEIKDWANRKTVFEYDTATNPNKPVMTRATGPTGCQTTYKYTPDGFLIGIIDPNGYETRYQYDSDGRVIARSIVGIGETKFDYDFSRIKDNQQYTRVTTDALGGKTTEVYTASNKLLSTTTPAGRKETSQRGASGITAKLVNGRPIGATIRDENGNIVTRIDAQGLKTCYTYDQYGNQTSETLPTGVVTKQIWGFPGSPFDETGVKRRLQVGIDAYGNRTTHMYDSFGQRVSTTDNHGSVTRYVYDQYGNMVSKKTSTGVTWMMKYDAAGNVIETTAADRDVTKVGYDAHNRPVQVTDQLGGVTKIAYDGNGNKTVMVDVLGNRYEWKYNVWDKVEAATSPMGYVTKREYDKLGRLVANIDALGNRTTTEYNLDGNVVASFDPLGYKTSYQYDQNGWQIAQVDALGHRTETLYDENNHQIGKVDALGNRTTITYDEYGRQHASTDFLGNKTSIIYDKYGRMETVIDPLGNKESTLYNEMGIAVARIDPLGNKTSRIYDDMGRVIGEIDALGHQQTNQYDAYGQVTGVVDASGAKTTIEYTSKGQLSAVVDALGYQTVWEYDAKGQKTAGIDPLGNKTLFFYNSDGKLIKRTDPRGITTIYNYDVAGNQTRIACSDGKEATFEYDANGNKIHVKDWTGESSYTYDAMGNLLTVTLHDGKKLRYSYDALNRRVRMTDHDGGVTKYGYDANGNVTSITNPFGESTTTSYDALGREVSKSFANGVKLAREYDASGQEISRKYTNAEKTLAAYLAEYDGAKNRKQVTEHDGAVVKYAYDSTHQLLSEERTGEYAFVALYKYDVLGNRLAKTLDGAVTRYEYDAANGIKRLVDQNGLVTDFAHDASGNLISATNSNGELRYTWDSENRLTTVANGPHTNEYVYNSENLRVLSKTADNDTRFLWDGQNMLAELDANGNTVAHYTDLPDTWGGLTSVRKGEASLHYTFDLSSNTRQLIDHTGAPAAKLSYDVYGVPLSAGSGNVTPYGYGGQVGYQTDFGDRLYVRARHYSTAEGRWISRDPIGLMGGDWNLHRYVGNRAVTRLDPTGLVPPSCGDEYAHCTAQVTIWLAVALVLATAVVGVGVLIATLCVGACATFTGGACLPICYSLAAAGVIAGMGGMVGIYNSASTAQSRCHQCANACKPSCVNGNCFKGAVQGMPGGRW